MPTPSRRPTSRHPATAPGATGRDRVFISHSSKNKSFADAVVADLESNGIPCWISSRDIRPGEPNYGKAILDGLSACRAVVLLLTEASNRSQHVMKEAERAVNRNIPILVARFQPVNVSRDLEYYVSSAQFLDATTPPPQQHLRTIRSRVRDMLANQSAADVVIAVPPRQSRRRPRWGLRLAGLGVVAAALLAAWLFVVPTLRSMLSKLETTVARTLGSPESSDASTPVVPPVDTESPGRPSSASAGDSGGAGSLLAGVTEKARASGALAAFATSRLATFHRDALLVTKSGTLVPGKVTDADAEIMASCRIEPNMEGYTTLATELIELLDKTALRKGTITSDGLKTSERYEHDARPHLQKIAREQLGSSGGLLDIFASDAHETLVRQHAGTGRCPFVSFATPFLIYDEKITAENMSGIHALHWIDDRSWSTLLHQQGTGIVILLESTRNSFRHTTWRWFHLSPSDWTAVSSHTPRQFKCLLTLTDSTGSAVESDFYPLQQLGVGRVDDDRIMSLTPFFVNDDFEYYIPEVTLTKSVVVLQDDVPRIKDFTVTIDEIAAPHAQPE